MYQTSEEKVLSKMRRFGRKNGFCRCIAIVLMSITITFFHFVYYLRDNRKRLSLVFVPIILFATYSSFSFPIFEGWDNKVNTEAVVFGEWEEEELSISLQPVDSSILEEEQLIVEELYEDEYLDSGEYESEGMDVFDINAILDVYEDRPVSEKEEEEFDGTFSKDDWRLILVNKQHPIPEDYEVKLGTIIGSFQCDERIIDDLLAMFKAAKEDNINLEVRSPYRSLERQEYLFDRKIKTYMNTGLNYLESYIKASQIVTIPGCSEHQLGLSLDITCDYYAKLNEGFADTEAGQWLAEHCHEFGFIIRYPLGKEDVTGIDFEPWHFRYVGVEAATVIMEEGIALEEFVERLE